MTSRSTFATAAKRSLIVKLKLSAAVLTTYEDNSTSSTRKHSLPSEGSEIASCRPFPRIKIVFKRKREDSAEQDASSSNITGETGQERPHKRKRTKTNAPDQTLPPLRAYIQTPASSLAFYLASRSPTNVWSPRDKTMSAGFSQHVSTAIQTPTPTMSYCESCHSPKAKQLGYWILNTPLPGEKRDASYLSSLCPHKLRRARVMAEAYLESAKKETYRLEQSIELLQKQTAERELQHVQSSAANVHDGAATNASAIEVPGLQPAASANANPSHSNGWPALPEFGQVHQNSLREADQLHHDLTVIDSLVYLHEKHPRVEAADLASAMNNAYRHSYTDSWSQGYDDGYDDRVKCGESAEMLLAAAHDDADDDRQYTMKVCCERDAAVHRNEALEPVENLLKLGY
ncbi:hypothetical protein NA57DRAFT_54730 [Rhizodiscina lignyota]|uniref:Uncharacterized protein n=1 Tax=Rhizodiscina lignyota TaxID=1504668 RepID=A0A9P4IJW6_9PEZI|nr:hypothetical protein NA57DRAFT_54730 [Rhizodiscina lignyota]